MGASFLYHPFVVLNDVLCRHPVKLGLGVTSLIFDLIFIYQHFSYGRTKRFEDITDDNDSDDNEYFINEKQELNGHSPKIP